MHSVSFRNYVGHSSHMVESQDISLSIHETTSTVPTPSGYTGHSQHDTGSLQSSSNISRDLAHALSTKLCISAMETLSLSPYTEESLQQSSSAPKKQGTSESAQCTLMHLSSFSDFWVMSPCVSRNTWPGGPKSRSCFSSTCPALSTSLQNALTPFPYFQVTLN